MLAADSNVSDGGGNDVDSKEENAFKCDLNEEQMKITAFQNPYYEYSGSQDNYDQIHEDFPNNI